MPEDSARTRQAETRRLAAIMFTDIVGFSRQMGADEARMLRLLEVHNHVIEQAIATHHGHVIKTFGDAFLVDFPSVVHAVQCAQHIQTQFRTHNAEQEKTEQIHVRIGLHLGDIVVQQNGDVLGDGVNIASRLQTLAEPDTIYISHKVYEEVEKKLTLGTVVSLGRPKLKNIASRFPVYALLSESPKGLRQTLDVQRWKLKHQKRTWQVAAAVLAVGVVSVGTLVIKNFYFPAAPQSIPQGSAPTPAPALPLPDKPSIVVLPFANMSNDPEQDYFSDGITEDLTSDLSKISNLFVIARNSAFTYKGKAVKVQDVSREMGVRYVLEGSVRKADNQVRITAQLIDGTTGGHLWSERYDRPLQDVFALQDEVRQQIVANLRVEVLEAETARVQRVPTENLTAYDLYLRGLEAVFHALRETKQEANVQARQMFEKAIELDPHYAGAYAELGFTYWLAHLYGWDKDRAQSLEQAFTLAQKAVALDDALPLSHRILGQVYLWKKQHEQAIAEMERAITLDPNNADGYERLGNVLANAGRPKEAIGLIEEAMRLNPRYPSHYLVNLGIAHLAAGQYDEALIPLKRVLALTPNFAPAHANLAVCYAELGRLEEARAEMAEAQRLVPNTSLEGVKQSAPFKDPADLERYLAALRKAGLK
jgi:adenylate cyclase